MTLFIYLSILIKHWNALIFILMFCSDIRSSRLPPLIPLNYFHGLISKIKIVLFFLKPFTFIKNNLDILFVSYIWKLSLSLTLKMEISSAHFQDNIKIKPSASISKQWNVTTFRGIITLWEVSLLVLKNRTPFQKHILTLDIIHIVKHSWFLQY